MIRTVTYYECDLCKRAAEARSNPLSGWIHLPEEKAVCPYCAEEISTKRDAKAKLESERYQQALEYAAEARDSSGIPGGCPFTHPLSN